ncbi:hypothetical protein HFD88_009059 [Aspergillus terreus]|nr:hypothetical protein HFD88_009059 [Aspergillus terreus]
MSNSSHDFIPNFAGKVIILTGGHIGLYVTSPMSINYVLAQLGTSFSFLHPPDSGFDTSIELAKRGAPVYVASRSASKFKAAEWDILFESWHCFLIVVLQKTVDMAEKGSVRIVNVSSAGYARVEAVVTNASDLTTLAISTWALRLSSLR